MFGRAVVAELHAVDEVRMMVAGVVWCTVGCLQPRAHEMAEARPSVKSAPAYFKCRSVASRSSGRRIDRTGRRRYMGPSVSVGAAHAYVHQVTDLR